MYQVSNASNALHLKSGKAHDSRFAIFTSPEYQQGGRIYVTIIYNYPCYQQSVHFFYQNNKNHAIPLITWPIQYDRHERHRRESPSQLQIHTFLHT